MTSEQGWGLRFPDICLTIQKTSGENLNQENRPDRGSNPGRCVRGNDDLYVFVVVVLGFTTLLTSQVISVAFYSEREKADKFCLEALNSAWGSFTCRKYTARDPRLYFPYEGSHTHVVYALKNPSTQAGSEPANLGFSGEYDNQGTTRVDMYIFKLLICKYEIQL